MTAMAARAAMAVGDQKLAFIRAPSLRARTSTWFVAVPEMTCVTEYFSLSRLPPQREAEVVRPGFQLNSPSSCT
jgi:hypothetical protein